MSEAATVDLFTTTIFNPALLRKEDLVRGFVARQDLLERLLDDLRRVQPGTAPQHQLLIAQRGLGKTTLLRRLAFAIEDDPQLSRSWMPLVFPEEQYNVKNLSDFWLNCADALSDALDRTGDTEAAEALDRKVGSIPANPEHRSAVALSLLVDEAERLGRCLVLLVDNLDIVLDRLNRNEEWEFRRVISERHRLYIIGASSRALEALYEHGRAFYDYFQVHDLKALSDREMFALLERLAEDAGDVQVRRLTQEQPARLRALRVLTGGNPRTLVLLYRVLSQGPEGDVQRDMEQLLDLYTPLYKARFEEMAPQSQQVVDAMAIHWDPLTAADLAEKLAPLSVNQVSAQLKRLEDFGVVEKAPWFGEKKTAFQIAERFFNIWYLMRASRRVRRRLIWLVRFLEAWFEREELSARATKYLQRDPKTEGPGRYAEMALAYSQTVEDPYLRRNLESAGLRAALDTSVRGQFDFSDLPPEVQDRKQRMERLRDLRDRVLAMHLEGIEIEELWRVLAGSPHLNLEEKARIVDELPTLSPSRLSDLFIRLKRSENLLRQSYPTHAKDLTRLYEAIGTGEIADAYDVDGTLAVASRTGCEWLPSMAISSRTNTFLSPEEMSAPQLEAAEEAWHRLGTSRGYEAKAWNGLGNMLQFRLGRYAEAEKAYRRAIEFDPKLSNQWNGLGRLLAENLGRYEEAERAYRRAIEIDSTDSYPWNGLGNMLQFRLGRYEEAEQAYRRAIELDPKLSNPWNGLGILLADHLGRYEEAEAAYRRAIELDPKSPYPWGNLARLFERNADRSAEALAAFLTAAELDPANSWRRMQALRFARSLGTGPHLPAALQAVSRLHQLVSDDTETKFTLAGLLALSLDWAKASGLLEELAANELVQPDTRVFRAVVDAGHVSDAIALLKRTGADERWRPLYESLRAVKKGSRKYLRRIAPEIRKVADSIVDEIKPDLPQ